MGIDPKREALQTIVQCAKLYEKNLRDKNLLIVMGKEKNFMTEEIFFPKSNFLHLTGVEVKISSNEFYRKASKAKLGLNDFELKDDGTTRLKLNVLPNLLSMNTNMFATYSGTRPKLYTERLLGNIRGCLGFVKSEYYGNYYVPNTTLETDMRNESSDCKRVLFILRRDKKDTHYSKIIHSAKKVNKEILKDIPNVDYEKLM